MEMGIFAIQTLNMIINAKSLSFRDSPHLSPSAFSVYVSGRLPLIFILMKVDPSSCSCCARTAQDRGRREGWRLKAASEQKPQPNINGGEPCHSRNWRNLLSGGIQSAPRPQGRVSIVNKALAPWGCSAAPSGPCCLALQATKMCLLPSSTSHAWPHCTHLSQIQGKPGKLCLEGMLKRHCICYPVR